MSDVLVKINRKLGALKAFEPTVNDVIEECYANITARLNDGWTFKRLAEIISNEGFKITESSLRQAYRKIVKDKDAQQNNDANKNPANGTNE